MAPHTSPHPTWRHINAALGSLVVTVGFWLVGGAVPVAALTAVAATADGFLLWQGRTVGLMWAWSTLLLGLESLAFPVVTLWRHQPDAASPTQEQMVVLLTGVVFGLFSSVFWISFAWGLFRQAGLSESPGLPAADRGSPANASAERSGKKRAH
jgi:dolichyl-phosphate-mannose--protein O-mannosyl transferase